MRPLLAAALAAIALATASVAAASASIDRPAAAASDTRRGDPVRGGERWHCTPTACSGAPASPWSAALGFAAATLACAALARRPLLAGRHGAGGPR